MIMATFILMAAASVAMWIQYVLIAKSKESPVDWHRTLDRYRILWRFNIIFAFGILIIFIFILTLNLFGSDGVSKAKSGTDAKFAPLLSFFLLFFIGAARLFVERAHGEHEGPLSGISEIWWSFVSPRRSVKSIGTPEVSLGAKGGENVWLWLFGASIAFAGFTHFSPGFAIESEFENLKVAIAGIIVFFGYLCWIYMLLFRKLTDEHHFTANASRMFLGHIFSSDIPKQAILIGPPGGGKSTFILTSPASDSTTQIEMRTQHVNVSDDVSRSARVSIIDLPGENMRDYVLLSSNYRADTLVLMLRTEWLNPEKLVNSELYKLDRWHSLVLDEFSSAQMYLTAVHFATHGDAAIKISDLFRVRSFVLYLNRFPGDETKANVVENIRVDEIRQLARDLGRRFGVGPGECYCFPGDASNAAQGLHLLAEEKMLEKRHGAWIQEYKKGR